MFEQSAMNVFFIATCPAIGSGAGRRPRDILSSCPCRCPCPCPCLCPCPCSCSSCLGSWRLWLLSVCTHQCVVRTHTQSQTKALPLNWAAVAPAQRCHIWFLLEAASEIGAFNVCLLPFTLTAPSARPLADDKSTRSAVDVSVYKLNISQTLTLECLF